MTVLFPPSGSRRMVARSFSIVSSNPAKPNYSTLNNANMCSNTSLSAASKTWISRRTRWRGGRPFNGKDTIVIDPTRAFGQPVAAEFGVPTVVLADAVKIEGSIERVAKLYEIAVPIVLDAVKFEESLIAA